jgi:hypothetical protein
MTRINIFPHLVPREIYNPHEGKTVPDIDDIPPIDPKWCASHPVACNSLRGLIALGVGGPAAIGILDVLGLVGDDSPPPKESEFQQGAP